jgi:hypothetical protein
MAKKADKAKMVALPGSSHPVRVGSKAVRQTSGQRWLELTVGVRPIKPLLDLSALDHKLPADRTYMTREQLAGQYGSDPKAVEAIEASRRLTTSSLRGTSQPRRGWDLREPWKT